MPSMLKSISPSCFAFVVHTDCQRCFARHFLGPRSSVLHRIERRFCILETR